MKRCRTCDQHAVDPMLNELCCDCAIAAQQASTGAAPMSREQDSVAVQGSPEWYVDELRTLAYNITGRGVGICNGAALTIEKLYRLTREAAPQASGGDDLPCTDSDNCRRCSEDADTPHSGIPRGTLATTDSAIQSQQGATGGAVAWIWEERTYSGHWEVKTGLSVPEYHEAEKWVRSARPLVYGCLAHPQAAGSAPGEAQREVVREGVARGTIKHYRNIPPPPAPPPPQRTQPSGSVASGAVRGEVTDEMVDKFNEVRLRVSGELSVYEHTRETLRRWLECIHG